MKIVFQDDPQMKLDIENTIEHGSPREAVHMLATFLQRSTFKTENTTGFLTDLYQVVDVLEKLSSDSDTTSVKSYNSFILGRQLEGEELLNMVEEDLDFLDSIVEGKDIDEL